MSLDYFLGAWHVNLTSGTPFGFGTVIQISDDNGTPTVEFAPPVSAEPLVINYFEADDVAEISGVDGVSPMLFSVYTDPDPSIEFRALYGMGLIRGIDGKFTHGVACGARFEPESGLALKPQPTATGSPEAADFSVSGTSGTQFGRMSRLSFVPAGSNDGTSLTITSPTASVITMPVLAPVNSLNTTFRGILPATDESPRIAQQVTIATLEGRRRCFGISVAGDPEGAGVWAADEVDPAPLI